MVAGFLVGNTVPLGDGVDKNDKPFLSQFPYLAARTPGSTRTPRSGSSRLTRRSRRAVLRQRRIGTEERTERRSAALRPPAGRRTARDALKVERSEISGRSRRSALAAQVGDAGARLRRRARRPARSSTAPPVRRRSRASRPRAAAAGQRAASTPRRQIAEPPGRRARPTRPTPTATRCSATPTTSGLARPATRPTTRAPRAPSTRRSAATRATSPRRSARQPWPWPATTSRRACASAAARHAARARTWCAPTRCSPTPRSSSAATARRRARWTGWSRLKPNLAAYARISYFRELHGDLDGAVAGDAARGLGRRRQRRGRGLRPGAARQASSSTAGRYGAAEHAYREALAIDPGYPPALAGLAARRGRPGRLRRPRSAATAQVVERLPAARVRDRARRDRAGGRAGAPRRGATTRWSGPR